MKYTNLEILNKYDRDFYVGALQFKKGIINTEDLKSFMPSNSSFSINDKSDLHLKYFCNNTAEILDRDLAGVVSEGPEYLLKITHPYSIDKVFPDFINNYKFGDKYQPFVRFQKIKPIGIKDFLSIRTTVVISEQHEGMLTMHNFLADVKNPKSINRFIEKEFQFVHRNYDKFSLLTAKEKVVLGLLGEGVRPKDISEQIFTSYENTRRQIKKINEKLGLTHSAYNKAAIYAKYAIYFQLI